MPLAKVVATAVCVGVLGVQGVIASPPLLPRYGWNWPFLPYPMYAMAHARADSLVVSELRVADCSRVPATTVMSPELLGTPLYQLPNLTVTIARAPESDAARAAMGKISRAVEAQFPGRYCSASAWVRTVRVGDTATYALGTPMRRAAEWTLSGHGGK
jgi:hypothetical protein